MTFALNNSNTSFDGTSGTTSTCVVTGVIAGDVVCVYAYNDTVDGAPVTCSDGTSTLSAGTYAGNITVFGRMFRLAASVASGSVTYTVTYGAATTGRGVAVYVFTPTPTGGASLDTEAAATFNDTAINSGNILTTGNDELVFGADTSEQGSSTFLINGAGITGFLTPNAGGHLWYKTFNAPFTGAASSTEAGSGRWAGHIGSFKITGGAAGPPLMGQACL